MREGGRRDLFAEPIGVLDQAALVLYVPGTNGQRERRIVMAGKFELYKDKSGKFRFRLKASNGQVIATGEAYETKASALNGIESVKKNSPGASTDDQTS